VSGDCWGRAGEDLLWSTDGFGMGGAHRFSHIDANSYRPMTLHTGGLATEARQRADQRRRGDLDPAYLYGLSEGLERSAAAIRSRIAAHGKRTG
jgi:hypothetical protein